MSHATLYRFIFKKCKKVVRCGHHDRSFDMHSSLTTLKVDQHFRETVDGLKKSTKATSNAEIIRRAVALMKLLQDAKDKGDKIVIRTESSIGTPITEREIIMP
jgi:hypothetical protein